MNLSEIFEALRSTLLATVIFALIPTIWWLIKGRKQATFLNYFGLTKPKFNGKSALIAIIIYCVVWIITHLPIFAQFTQPSASKYLGMGASAIIPILIISFLQTGTLEEFLFRGFINKRLVKMLGLQIGTIVQAVIFGAIHLLLASNVNFTSGLIVFLTTAIGGYMLGYISEKSFKGSIIPGIILHGLGNFIINIIQAFIF